MKQLLGTVLILLWVVNVDAQFIHSTDIVAGVGSSFRIIDGDGSMTELRRNELEVAKINGHIGFNYNYKIGKSMFLKTGVRFLSLGYKTIAQELVFPNRPSQFITFSYDYFFIELPINVRYEFKTEKKLVPFFELGVAPMFLYSNRKVESREGQEDVSTKERLGVEFNKTHLALNANMGLIYSFVELETQLFLQGGFRYDFTSLVDQDGFSESLYAYGVELGVRRKIY